MWKVKARHHHYYLHRYVQELTYIVKNAKDGQDAVRQAQELHGESYDHFRWSAEEIAVDVFLAHHEYWEN